MNLSRGKKFPALLPPAATRELQHFKINNTYLYKLPINKVGKGREHISIKKGPGSVQVNKINGLENLDLTTECLKLKFLDKWSFLELQNIWVPFSYTLPFTRSGLFQPNKKK